MAPRVAPPRVQVGRSAGPSRPVRKFVPMAMRGQNAKNRTSSGWSWLKRDKSVKNIESLDKIKDPAVYREVRRAISRFHSVLGVRNVNIVLADLPKDPNTIGRHTSSPDEPLYIVLNKKYFNKSKQEVEQNVRSRYKSGWSTKTNKPVAHTVTHELAHALWTDNRRGANYRQAGDEIKALRKKWQHDRKRNELGYGQYSRKNVDEFWAEVITKAVHGTPDKYTEAAKEIIKKYHL